MHPFPTTPKPVRAVFDPLAPAFTRPTHYRFVLLARAAILAVGGHTVANRHRGLGALARGHPSNNVPDGQRAAEVVGADGQLDRSQFGPGHPQPVADGVQVQRDVQLVDLAVVQEDPAVGAEQADARIDALQRTLVKPRPFHFVVPPAAAPEAPWSRCREWPAGEGCRCRCGTEITGCRGHLTS